LAINDTIAAVATPPAPGGAGGVGIIRISGPEALGIARRIFSPASARAFANVEERRLYYGKIHSTGGEVIDDAFMVFFKAPRSFTGEDTVELQCHGSALLLGSVLSACLSAGAREAGPGEFTRQAFVNDKLDLAQAEALLDLIRAGTNSALASARARLDGRLSEKIRGIKETLYSLAARMEAELDFPDDSAEGSPGLSRDEISRTIGAVRRDMESLASGYLAGRAATEGVNALILGRPNAGKSSLLNALLRETRAIVTPKPGTTRDIIEETIDVRGLAVKLMDTAGLRDAEDEAERMGVRFAFDRLPAADVVLFVIDASAENFDEDISLLEKIGDKRAVIAGNKSDLTTAAHRKRALQAFAPKPLVFISALKEAGIKELEDALYEAATGKKPSAGGLAGEAVESVVTSARHKALLDATITALGRGSLALAEGAGLDAIVTDVRAGIGLISQVTGENATEEILDRIFSEFCIGK
jgi:tRNA modification GTPase